MELGPCNVTDSNFRIIDGNRNKCLSDEKVKEECETLRRKLKQQQQQPQHNTVRVKCLRN